MKMTVGEVRRLVGLFLAQHPEHAAGAKEDATLGPVMESKALRAFAAWCADRGLATPEKVWRFHAWLAERDRRN